MCSAPVVFGACQFKHSARRTTQWHAVAPDGTGCDSTMTNASWRTLLCLADCGAYMIVRDKGSSHAKSCAALPAYPLLDGWHEAWRGEHLPGVVYEPRQPRLRGTARHRCSLVQQHLIVIRRALHSGADKGLDQRRAGPALITLRGSLEPYSATTSLSLWSCT